jgi:hypothetical protein
MRLFETWKKIVFEPKEFYDQLPTKNRYREANLFFLKISAITLGIVYAIMLMLGLLLSGLASLFGGKSVLMFALAAIGIALLLFPIFLLISWGGLYIGAAITHLFVLMFGGKEGYKETFKVVAYSIAPNIFSFVPIVNWFVGIYILVLQVIGIHRRQKLSIGKSVAVVLLPVVIIFAIIGIVYASLFFAAAVTGVIN